ncbi:hypothetical protein [Mycolicibacterium sp. P9-22]|uniref:hypothetical protein n=1 Tax=Mycolicibacterium sp. P9-22 TaxID=2024613 RepID=UPI0011EFD867|nr:hypothetical protein [Mycolicibacterium sp. P9-22]KAA0114474.1 hypothetical protein CIW51_19410 [Mycolicibacterium sp. P9-22]
MASNVFRQTLSTGVVLASAGAIALTPVTVTPEIRAVIDTPRVVTTDVLPAGLIQDLQLVGNGARAVVEQSVDALTRKIPDLWWTVHEQWPDADLLHWNYALVSDIFLAPITPLLIGPLNDAVAEAVARNFPILGDEIRRIPDFVEYAFVRLIGPVLSAIGGAGVAHSEIFYSMTTLRIEPFIEAIVRAPLHVIDGLIFGGYGDLGPILPGREGQYIPAPGLLTPWGQPPRVRNVKTPNDILTTTVPEAGANLVTLSTGRGGSATEPNTAVTEPTTDTVIDTPVETAVEPVIDTVTHETETTGETPEPATTEPVMTEPAGAVTEETETAETTKPAKPAKKDPAAAIRQGLKDFGDNVSRTVKKLTGGGASSRPESQSGNDKSESNKSESTGSEDSE